MYLIAEFRDQRELENAIRGLKAEGFGVADMDLFSEEPVEFRRGILDRPSRMSLVAVLGAILSGGAATGFVYYAQHNFVLVTGGMPVFSMWGTGVITYETTLLGAVIATFVWFLWESGLIRKRDVTAPVPSVPPGSMHLRIRCSGVQQNAREVRAIEILQSAGAGSVERKEHA